jgi:hypothetical protein
MAAAPNSAPAQLALLGGRYRRDSTGDDLAALGNKTLQRPDVLVIDLRRIGSREGTAFAAPEEGAAHACAGAYDAYGHVFFST